MRADGLALLLVLGLASPGPAHGGDSLPVQQIDALFAEWDRWDSPGAALAVVRAGELLYKRGYGSAQLEYGIPITPQSIFHVASLSKQFTDFAVVLLAQEGRLTLDDDVRKHLPEVPDFGQTITIRHLIHHMSGLRDQWELLAMAGWRLDDVITREHLLRMVGRQRELNFAPGAEHLYCNTGYTLLAEIVERVSGQPFKTFTEERVFRPLGMSRTHFHDDHEHIVPGRAYSYAPAPGDGFKNSVLSFANAGATSLFTTVEDLARWLVNLEEGTVGGKAAIEQMHERGRLADGSEIPYAFGLVHGTYRGLATVSHGGSDAGFRSFVVRFPEQQLGVVVLSNLSTFDPGGMAQRVADVVLLPLLGPPEARSELERVRLDPDVLDRHVGLYRLDIGSLVTVKRQGRRLLGEVPGQGEVELMPLSEREFAIEEIGARIVFAEPVESRSPGFETDVSGQRFHAERVEPLDGNQLAGLTGHYFSPELESGYALSLEEGRLIARHQRNGDVALVALGSDELAGNQWWFGSVRFERDGAGDVTGFRLSGMRVRNLLFVRTAQP